MSHRWSSNGSIAIVGAGPAGLMSALALARRGGFDITVFEAEEDHEIAPRYNPNRSYTIDITGHGLNALKYCDATKRFDDELLKFSGINMRMLGRAEPWEDQGWTGSRGDICRALTREIQDKQPGKVDFQWDTNVTVKDIYEGELELEKGGTKTAKSFDLIIGSDGAGATTRGAVAENVPGFQIEASQAGNYCMMIHFDTPAAAELNPEWLEVFSLDPFVVAGAINGEEGPKGPAKWFTMIGFTEETSFKNVGDAKKYIIDNGGQEIIDKYVSEEELQEFIKRPCNNIGRSKVCSQYHGGKVVMVGDSANPFPPIGQGINAAMEAAMGLDKAIGKALDDGKGLQAAAAQYTIDYKPEGDAVNWIARRCDFGSPFKMFLVKTAVIMDMSVLTDSKKATESYKEVADRGKKRNPEEWMKKWF